MMGASFRRAAGAAAQSIRAAHGLLQNSRGDISSLETDIRCHFCRGFDRGLNPTPWAKHVTRLMNTSAEDLNSRLATA